jgi:hypothetical protein
MARPRSATERAFVEQLRPMLRQNIAAGAAGLQALLAAEEAGTGSRRVSPPPEPPVPVSAGRFLEPPAAPD